MWEWCEHFAKISELYIRINVSRVESIEIFGDDRRRVFLIFQIPSYAHAEFAALFADWFLKEKTGGFRVVKSLSDEQRREAEEFRKTPTGERFLSRVQKLASAYESIEKSKWENQKNLVKPKRKRTLITDDLKREILLFVEKHREMTNKELTRYFGLSEKIFSKNEDLRKIVNMARQGQIPKEYLG